MHENRTASNLSLIQHLMARKIWQMKCGLWKQGFKLGRRQSTCSRR